MGVDGVEQQLMLFADRTSAATLRADQWRLHFSSIASVPVQALRRLEALGWGRVAERAVAPLGVVEMKLPRERRGAEYGRAIRLSVGPLVQQGADEAFGIPAALRAVRPGEAMARTWAFPMALSALPR